MAFALCFGTVPIAYAALEDDPEAKTFTHPTTGLHEPTGVPYDWRAGWGNELPASLYFERPPQEMNGFIYDISRFGSLVDTGSPSDYLRSATPTGTHFMRTFDLAATVEEFPVLDGRLLFPGQAMKAVEGPWWVAIVPYTVIMPQMDFVYSSNQLDYFFGVDQTPPSVPTNVRAYRSAASTQTLPDGVTTQRRVHVRWDLIEYDKLSGTALMNVYIDGVLRLGWKKTLQVPTDGVPWFGLSTGTDGVTIEDIGPGKHTIQVAAMDRATNESVKSPAITVFVDPDDPVVTITSPSAGGKLGVKPTVRATIKDLGGVKGVGFKVDSSNMGTITPSTVTTNYAAAKTLDLSAFANGGHTLTVTGLDMAGRTVSKAVSFTLDKSAPSMTITSKGPNPFYPRKRDGYKDNYVVKFNTNEPGTAYLDVYYGGKLYRSVKKPMVSGANSISWDGKSSSGALKATSYSVKLRLVDAAGNTRTSSSFGATIRFYEVVRTSSGSARVIER